MPVVLLNCIPVVADADVGSFNAGPNQVERVLSPLTSAIVVAHIAGEPADMAGIMALARNYGIPVVEDCAQAHGAKMNGSYVGAFAELASFSTMYSKIYSTGGQGGMVYTRDEGLYNEVRRAADRGKPFGLPEGSTNCMATLNFNMDQLSAAIGCEQLKKLPGFVARRREIAARIAGGIGALSTVSMPKLLPGTEPSYWFIRMRFNSEAASCDKTTFCKALVAEGLPVDPDYNHLQHTFEWCAARRVFGSSGYPWASPAYKGDPERKFYCPNAHDAIADHFILQAHQNWGEEEIYDAIEILAKVDAALRK